jgi:L-seryl-tRNA(Ser) seleniumtransferase
VLDAPAIGRLAALYGREPVGIQVRAEVERLRRLGGDELRLALGASPDDGGGAPAVSAAPPESAWIALVARRAGERLAARLGPPVRRVINATGILVHTNLGRAPLPPAVAAELPALLDASCDLEYDLASGRRGDRNDRADRLLQALTGAEMGLVVNNNAAALVLALAVLVDGERRQVVVSRGELVEIGGSFRLPDVLAQAGAELVEVGTTNRTRLADYAAAAGPATAALLKVHPSNYRVTGFTAGVGAAALADLGRRRGVPVLVDEGSGLLRPPEDPRRAPQLGDHDSLSALIAAGVDLACGSGDKVLCGPQAGLLVGRRRWVERCRRHPLYRALRPNRATLAALEAVLRLHLAGAPLPLDRLWPDPAAHGERLRRAASRLPGAELVAAEAYVGGGTAPERPIAGEALALPGGDELLEKLRRGDPPVVGYLREGRLVLDLRTVDPADDEPLLAALRAARDEDTLDRLDRLDR